MLTFVYQQILSRVVTTTRFKQIQSLIIMETIAYGSQETDTRLTFASQQNPVGTNTAISLKQL